MLLFPHFIHRQHQLDMFLQVDSVLCPLERKDAGFRKDPFGCAILFIANQGSHQSVSVGKWFRFRRLNSSITDNAFRFSECRM